MRRTSRSPDQTGELARGLAAALGPDGAVVVLRGPLGAGKTRFVKGLAEGLGLAPERVQSPTFVVAQELPLPDGRTLVHVDCYRVASTTELEGAGLLDWLAPGALVVAEWGERVPDAWPPDHLEVTLDRSGADPDGRDVEARACGPKSQILLERWESLG